MVSWFLLSFQVFSSSQWKPHWTGETVNTERHRVPGVMSLTQASLWRGASLEGAISHRVEDRELDWTVCSKSCWTMRERTMLPKVSGLYLGYEFPLQRNVGKVFPMCLFPFWFSWEYYFQTKNTSFQLYPERLLLALELRHECWTAKMTL